MGFYRLCNFGIDFSPKSAKKAAGCPPTPLYWGHLGESGYVTGSVRAPKRGSIPGSIRAPIAFFRTRFSGSSGSGVHAHGKYRLKRLFFENNGFNRDLSLQFSGLSRALFFWHRFQPKKCGKGCRMPSYTPLLRSPRRIMGFRRFCPVFEWLGIILVGGWARVRIFPENIFGNFSHAKKVFPDFNFSRKHFFGFYFLTGKVFPDFLPQQFCSGNFCVAFYLVVQSITTIPQQPTPSSNIPHL